MLHPAALILTVCGLLSAADTFTGRVVSITDGDTIRVLREAVSVPVRLDAIDAPEKKQPFGARSKEFVGALTFHQIVTVVQTDTDGWGRIVGEVRLQDGRAVNEELLKAGLAWVFVKYCKVERYYAP